MTRPLPDNYPITADFEAQRDGHKHSAIDIGAPKGVPILAPESGRLIVWCAYRVKDGHMWPETPYIGGKPFSFRNYFYDMYGGCVVLTTNDLKRTYVIAHIFAEQFIDVLYKNSKFHYFEEKSKKRFPLHAFYTEPIPVNEGGVIGSVGDSGTSTGPHIHLEVHNGINYNAYEDRINPSKLF